MTQHGSIAYSMDPIRSPAYGELSARRWAQYSSLYRISEDDVDHDVDIDIDTQLGSSSSMASEGSISPITVVGERARGYVVVMLRFKGPFLGVIFTQKISTAVPPLADKQLSGSFMKKTTRSMVMYVEEVSSGFVSGCKEGLVV